MAKMSKKEQADRRSKNLKRNKKLKFDDETEFMIMMVEDKDKVTRKGKDGKSFESLAGWYLIYNPDDELVSFPQKWMIVHNKDKDERERYSLIKYDEFKKDYDPIYMEWLEPQDNDDYPSTQATYEAEIGDAKYYNEGTKKQTKTEKKPRKEEKDMSEEETPIVDDNLRKYTNILFSEGWEQEDIDEKGNEQIEKMKGLINMTTALFIICKELGVDEKEIPEPPDDDEDLDTSKYSDNLMMKFMEATAAGFLKFGEILKSIDSRLMGVNEYLCTLTADETVSLKDFLPQSKIEAMGKITEEDIEAKPPKKSSRKKTSKKSSRKKK